MCVLVGQVSVTDRKHHGIQNKHDKQSIFFDRLLRHLAQPCFRMIMNYSHKPGKTCLSPSAALPDT